jgi:hypothetical protein
MTMTGPAAEEEEAAAEEGTGTVAAASAFLIVGFLGAMSGLYLVVSAERCKLRINQNKYMKNPTKYNSQIPIEH